MTNNEQNGTCMLDYWTMSNMDITQNLSVVQSASWLEVDEGYEEEDEDCDCSK